jgi:hypothetical protein
VEIGACGIPIYNPKLALAPDAATLVHAAAARCDAELARRRDDAITAATLAELVDRIRMLILTALDKVESNTERGRSTGEAADAKGD